MVANATWLDELTELKVVVFAWSLVKLMFFKRSPLLQFVPNSLAYKLYNGTHIRCTPIILPCLLEQ